jgi:hypothetical protein
MARFRCRSCSEEGTFVYTGGHACPLCGSRDVQLTIDVEELSDDNITALTALAESEPPEADD